MKQLCKIVQDSPSVFVRLADELLYVLIWELHDAAGMVIFDGRDGSLERHLRSDGFVKEQRIGPNYSHIVPGPCIAQGKCDVLQIRMICIVCEAPAEITERLLVYTRATSQYCPA